MLSGCLVVWLSGCLVVWLSGCLVVLAQKLAVLVATPSAHYNIHFLSTFALQFRDAVFAFLLSLKESQLRDTTSDAMAVRTRTLNHA